MDAKTAGASMSTQSSRTRYDGGSPAIIRLGLLTFTFLLIGLILVLPLALVLSEAFRKGWTVYNDALVDSETVAALQLTLITALTVVPINAVFGVAAAYVITRFNFRGKQLLLTIIDTPLAVSPVIAGMLFILLFGPRGWFGAWIVDHGFHVIFAWPGILLATLFVTLPYVVRELVPLMQFQGAGQEESAITLGASGFRMFTAITLPNIKWGLLYGLVLCTARAIGEFGAVSVVSGHIRGETNTLPLHIEVLYNEYNFVGAFAVSSLLVGIALILLICKQVLEMYGSGSQR